RCAPASDYGSRRPEVADMAAIERIAFLGLGIMGRPMAANLVRAGFQVTVWNRTRERAEEFAAEHDARVAATPAGAAAGAQLAITGGGQSADFERARPAFEAMGELIVHVGPQGHGSMVKLINNTLAAVNAEAVAEALALARRAGVDPDALLKVVGAGSGASTMLELKARPMLEHDYEPLFKLEHM